MIFEVTASDPGSSARAGLLRTPGGDVETPLFMPVGTGATVKGMRPEQVRELGFEMVLCNAYHLWLRPGVEAVSRAGGVGRFMGWEGPVLTDSGGYQVLSLGEDVRITRDGASFRSHLDGSRVFLTPEMSMEVQRGLGADIAMVLDECLPYPSERGVVEASVELNADWSSRCRLAHGREGPLLFGIVQGGTYPDLRAESARRTAETGFDGYGLGGLSVGEPRELTLQLVEETLRHLPPEAPRYFMGLGDPAGIAAAVSLGVDMFDSVLPTRIARNGSALVGTGRLNLRNARFSDDQGPLDESCACYTCGRFSRSYLRHLVMSREMLGFHLLTVHNLHQVSDLLSRLRSAIRRGGVRDVVARLSGVEAPQ